MDGDVGRCGAILRDVEDHVAGHATNAHWCVDGVVVRSDWCGAQSFLVDDLDALCAGLGPEVAARTREFASRSGVQALGEEGEHGVDGHL